MNGNEFAALSVMLYFAVLLFDGARLIRSMAWLALWFALTSVRDWYIDVPFSVAGFTATESLYLVCTRVGRRLSVYLNIRRRKW